MLIPLELFTHSSIAIYLLLMAVALVAITGSKGLLPKVLAVVLLLISMPASFYVHQDLLSRAKPLGFEAVLEQIRKEITGEHTGELTLEAANFIEDGRIEIAVMMQGELRLFYIPWDRKLAENLQHLLDEAQRRNLKLRMDLWEHSWDPEKAPRFYLPPPERFMPEKEPETPPREIYRDA